MYQQAKSEILRQYQLEHGETAADAFEKDHNHRVVGANVGLYTGAASGALIGSAIFPGIGTVVGGLIGGFLGFTSGADDKKTADNLKTTAKSILGVGGQMK